MEQGVGGCFAGHAKDFELNPRYHEWSLVQFNFLKEHVGE